MTTTRHSIRILTLLSAMLLTAAQGWGNSSPSIYITDLKGGELSLFTDEGCTKPINITENNDGSIGTASLEGISLTDRTVYIKAKPNFGYTLKGFSKESITIEKVAPAGAAQARTATRSDEPAFATINVGAINVDGNISDPSIYSFDMPEEGDVVISATFPEKEYKTQVEYMDWDNDQKKFAPTKTEAGQNVYVLDGTETELGDENLGSVWYMVPEGDVVTYRKELKLIRTVRLILSDGQTMYFDIDNENECAISGGDDSQIEIFGQENGTGQLHATGTATGISADHVEINGGYVDAAGTEGIKAGTIDIWGGEVRAQSTEDGDKAIAIYGTSRVNITGGKVDTDGIIASDGSIQLGWTDAENDYIMATGYDGNVTISEGYRFLADFDGFAAKGIVSGSIEDVSTIAKKKLTPIEGNLLSLPDYFAIDDNDKSPLKIDDNKYYTFNAGDKFNISYWGDKFMNVAATYFNGESDEYIFLTDHSLDLKGIHRDVNVLAEPISDITTEALTYNGEKQMPKTANYTSGTFNAKIEIGEDYTIDEAYSQVNAGSYTAPITGLNSYFGEAKVSFTILPKEVTPTITITNENSLVYNYGEEITPEYTVTYTEGDGADPVPKTIDADEFIATIKQKSGLNEQTQEPTYIDISDGGLTHSGSYAIFIADAKTDDTDTDTDQGNYTISDTYQEFAVSPLVLEDVTYYDGTAEKATVRTAEKATVLEGHETELAGGWYIAPQGVTYDHDVKLVEDVNLILADGTTTSFQGITDKKLSIRFEPQGTGQLKATAFNCGMYSNGYYLKDEDGKVWGPYDLSDVDAIANKTLSRAQYTISVPDNVTFKVNNSNNDVEPVIVDKTPYYIYTPSTTVTLNLTIEDCTATYSLNGTAIEGNSFTMPYTDAVVTTDLKVNGATNEQYMSFIDETESMTISSNSNVQAYVISDIDFVNGQAILTPVDGIPEGQAVILASKTEGQSLPAEIPVQEANITETNSIEQSAVSANPVPYFFSVPAGETTRKIVENTFSGKKDKNGHQLSTDVNDYKFFILDGFRFMPSRISAAAAVRQKRHMLSLSIIDILQALNHKIARTRGTSAGTRTIHIDINGIGDTTGIDSIGIGTTATGDWYSLDGRKLEGKPQQKGVYINNGHKTVIK